MCERGKPKKTKFILITATTQSGRWKTSLQLVGALLVEVKKVFNVLRCLAFGIFCWRNFFRKWFGCFDIDLDWELRTVTIISFCHFLISFCSLKVIKKERPKVMSGQPSNPPFHGEHTPNSKCSFFTLEHNLQFHFNSTSSRCAPHTQHHSEPGEKEEIKNMFYIHVSCIMSTSFFGFVYCYVFLVSIPLLQFSPFSELFMW